MVYELERVLRVCNGFLCSMSVTYDGAVLLWQYCTITTAVAVLHHHYSNTILNMVHVDWIGQMAGTRKLGYMVLIVVINVERNVKILNK